MMLLALPADVARLRAVHLADGVEDRRLAGAVGADDGEQLGRAGRENDTSLMASHAAEPQPDLVDLEQRLVIASPVHAGRLLAAPHQ